MKRSLSVGLVLLLFVLVGLNSLRYFARVDLTTTGANTISSVSRNLAKDIPDQVSIRYYISEKLRSNAQEPDQIIDILEEYAAYARGKILVEIVDPIEEGREEEVMQLGISPQQIQVIEESEQSIAVVYTGLVLRYLDAQKVFPVIFDPLSIEYQLTSAIRQLVRDDERIVGIYTRQGEALQDSYSLLLDALRKNFEVRSVEVGQPIPDEIDTLVLTDKPDYDDAALYYIDQYLLSGAAALFAVDGVDVVLDTQTGAIRAQGPKSSPLHDLLAHYGVEVEQVLLLDERSLSLPVVQQSGAFRIQTFVDYQHWVHLVEPSDREHAITARFSGLDLFWPSPLSVEEREGLQVLLSSSNDSWLMQDEFSVSPDESFRFRVGSDESQAPYPLLVSSYGALSRYDAIAVPEAADLSQQREEGLPSRIVVVGDSDFFSDIIRVTNSAGNISLVENVVEWLSNDEDLLSIRSRSARNLALDKIADAEKERSLQTLVRWVNLFVVPFLVVLVGVFVMWRKKNEGK